MKISDNKPAGYIIVFISILLGLLFRVHAIIHSDPLLVISSIEDDSFYYIVPAWNFKHLLFFSFDGVNTTYGWQPLWMLVLAWVVAPLCATMSTFLNSALILSAFMFGIGCIVLFTLIARYAGRYTVLASVVFSAVCVLNSYMLEFFSRGKESALQFLLLALGLFWFQRVVDKRNIRFPSFFALGLLLGLLTLSRVNAFICIPVVCLLIGIIYYGNTSWRAIVSGIGAVLAGSFLIILPWCVYAVHNFGTWFPTSGLAKLGAKGAMHGFSPWGALDFLRECIRGMVIFRDLFTVYLWGVFIVFSLAAGGWLLHHSIHSRSGRRNRGMAADAGGRPQPPVFVGLNLFPINEFVRRHAALIALFLYAAGNYLSTLFFLRKYFYYGVWYHVPEYLFAVFILPVFFVGLFASTDTIAPARRLRSAFLQWSFAGMVLALALLTLGSKIYRHKLFFRSNPVAVCVHDAQGAIRGSIPSGARIGAMNSGIYGYMLRDYSVVNLDGLANSREYVISIRSGNEAVRDWLRKWRIRYILDSANLHQLQTAGYAGFLKRDDYDILYTSEREYSWGKTPLHFFIIRLTDTFFEGTDSQ